MCLFLLPVSPCILDQFPTVRQKDEQAQGRYPIKERIYDAVFAAQRSGQPYQIRLEPPPGNGEC